MSGISQKCKEEEMDEILSDEWFPIAWVDLGGLTGFDGEDLTKMEFSGLLKGRSPGIFFESFDRAAFDTILGSYTGLVK
jgi:hypothetical protein